MPYFTAAELATRPDMDASRYTVARMTEAEAWFAALVERHVGVPFVSTAGTATLSGTGRRGIVAPSAYLLTVTAATIDGTALTSGELSSLTFGSGVVNRALGEVWACGVDNVTLTYTYGADTEPPPDLKQAGLEAARDWLIRTYGHAARSARASKVTTEQGTVDIVMPGPDRATGLPTVDVVLNGYRDEFDVFGFA